VIARKIYYLTKLIRSRKAEVQALQEFQEERLKSVLPHAESRSSFYNARWRDAGFDAEEFERIEDLKNIPVIDKSSVRDEREKIKTLAPRNKGYSSTGTSGESFTVPFDEQAADWREAVTARTELLKGYRPREKVVELFGRPQNKIGQIIQPKKSIPKEATLSEQIAILNEENPSYLIYSPHVLFRICKKLEHREDTDIRIKGVFCVGELLTPEMRKTIEDVLGAKLYSIYETSEVGQIAWQCPEGGYHVNQDLVHLEILDNSGNPVKPGQRGHAVVTSLVNRVFPLIRYRIGDTLVKGKKTCSCSTNFKKIQRIEGRTDNIITNDKDRDLMPREIIDTLAEFKELEKFIFEKENNSYRIRYSPGPNFNSSTTQKIKQRLSEIGFNSVKLREDSIDGVGWKAGPVRNLDAST
jgi:phenylacetate-CoA ligase